MAENDSLDKVNSETVTTPPCPSQPAKQELTLLTIGDPGLSLLRSGISALLAAAPTITTPTPTLTIKEQIDRKVLRHSMVKQRKQIEKYTKYMIDSFTHETPTALTKFFAYFIEQINIAGTLFGQYFDHHNNEAFQNRFPDFVEYLLDAFTYLDENNNHYSQEDRMHMLASCRKDYSSTKMEKFFNIKDFLSYCDALAKSEHEITDREFYLSLHNYSNRLYSMTRLFESALWQRNSSLIEENHDNKTTENDKYFLEGLNPLTTP